MLLPNVVYYGTCTGNFFKQLVWDASRTFPDPLFFQGYEGVESGIRSSIWKDAKVINKKNHQGISLE